MNLAPTNLGSLKAALVDIDGTLVDSNDLHVSAWVIAFGEAGLAIDRATIRGQIGKGGDLLVPTLAPELDEAAQQKATERHGEVFKERFLDRVQPFSGAHDLIAYLNDRGIKIVLASSASQGELDHYCKLLDIADLVDATTTIDDVETSKPAPEIFVTAMSKLPGIAPADALVIGDTPYDCEAAAKAGIPAIAVRSGGFDEAALREAGAKDLYDDVADLLAKWKK